MIVMTNKDRKIYDIEHLMIDVVAEYLSTGKIDISLNSEGPCAESLGLYRLLDHLCDSLKIDKSSITIHTQNALEQHNEYNIVISASHWIESSKQRIPKEAFNSKQLTLKTLGFFAGRASWPRMILGAWLYNNYKDKCLMSFNYDHSDIDKIICELDELNFFMGQELTTATAFLEKAPILLDGAYHHKQSQGEQLWQDVNGVYQFYDQIFAELLVETYITGRTFYVTEKSVRVFATKTPFLAFGPVGYLKNLKKLGFKTFDSWWSESYDDIEGADRIDAIKIVVKEILSWPQERLHTTLEEMKEVLDHNYNHYMTNSNWRLA